MSRISPRLAPAAIGPQPAGGDGLSLAQVPAILRRSLAWIAVPTLAVAVGSGVFVNVVSPRYTGEAKVILESRDQTFARTSQERADQAAPIDEQAVASQVQVMMSRDLAREAIRQLKLVGNPEFDPGADAIGPVSRLLMLLGIGRNPLDRPAEDRVLDSYFERLLVFPAGKSRILTVEFRSKDAKLAADGANTVAQLYIASLAADKVDTARYASTWLGGNIESLRKRVAEAEAKVEAFRARHGLVGATGAAGQPLTAQQLGELSSQLSQARIIKADLAGRVKAIKDLIKDGRAFEIPDVANNEVIRRTVENRITVRAQLAMESRTLLPAHPRIKELRAQLDDLDAQIKASAERVVRTMENDAKIAGSRVESLQAAVDGQQDVVVKGNSSEIQLRALEREAKAQREQLESYLGRFREATARDAESATPADARIVSRAVTPEIPSFPKKLPIVGFATLLTLMLAAGGVIARALLADGAAPRARPGAAPAGAGPADASPAGRPAYPEAYFPEALPPNRWPEAMAGTRARRPASATAPAPAAEAHAAAFDLDPLIARLSAGRPRWGASGGRTVLVVQAQTARGPHSLSDAMVLALSGGLLSIDLDATEVAPTEVGFTDLVAGEAAFLDVIQAARGGGLHRIGPGFVEDDVLTGEPEALALTFEAAAQAYDWVICRLPASAGSDIVAGIAAHMDGVVIASNAAPDDPALADLYAAADEAGAGLVLVAQDRAAEADADLRLTAA